MVILITYLSFRMIKPFLVPIIASVIIAYIFYPLYRRINKKIKRKNLSALITSALVIIIVTLPLFLALNTIAKETRTMYIVSKQKIVAGNVFGAGCSQDTFICKAIDWTSSIAKNPKVVYYLDDAVKKITTLIGQSATSFIFAVPRRIMDIFIILFVMFYSFRDGKAVIEKFESLAPIKRLDRKKILNKFNDVIYAVVYGHIIIAIVQGSLGALGFFIFGVPNPLLWGLVMILFALIPFLGHPVVWLPIAVFKIFNGYIEGDSIVMTKGLLLILYGVLIIGTIDNILKPRIIGKKADIHPVLVLLGVLGGLFMFGFIGIIVGPVILGLLFTFLEIYRKEIG